MVKGAPPPWILKAVAYVESAFNPNAVNKDSGARGLFQFMPETAKQYGINPFSPSEAAAGAAKYLADLMAQFRSLPLALAAYNWGPGNLAKFGPERMPKETREYVLKVLGAANAG